MTTNKILLAKAEYDTAKARLFRTLYDEHARDRYPSDLTAYFTARDALHTAQRAAEQTPLDPPLIMETLT